MRKLPFTTYSVVFVLALSSALFARAEQSEPEEAPEAIVPEEPFASSKLGDNYAEPYATSFGDNKTPYDPKTKEEETDDTLPPVLVRKAPVTK